MGPPRGHTRTWITRLRLYGLLLRGQGPADPAQVVGHLTALQAQDHAYTRWSVAQRTAGVPGAARVDSAFDDGRILRTHVLRPTWHYVAASDLRWLIRFSGPRVDAANEPKYREVGLDARTLDRATALIADAVAQGPRTRHELAHVLDDQGIATADERLTFMLMHAELTGVVCSGPMRGRQHTYATFDERVPNEPGPQGDEALAELSWRYFSTRGPATTKDFSWWSGLSAADARRGLALVEPRLVSHERGGRTYWFIERALPRPGRPVIDLVARFDEVIISYGQTRDVLQTSFASFPLLTHIDGFHHVLLIGGRLLGHWRPHPDPGNPTVEVRTSRALGAEEDRAMSRAVERYVRFTQSVPR